MFINYTVTERYSVFVLIIQKYALYLQRDNKTATKNIAYKYQSANIKI